MEIKSIDKRIPEKLKNPFDGQDKDVIKEFQWKLKSLFDRSKDDGRNPNIPGRIKLPADDKPRKDNKKD